MMFDIVRHRLGRGVYNIIYLLYTMIRKKHERAKIEMKHARTRIE